MMEFYIMSNETLIKQFVNQSTVKTSAKSANVSFAGNALFSYRTLIAFIKDDNLIISSRGYSNTTARHQSLIRYYGDLKYNVVLVHDVNQNAIVNITELTRQKLEAEGKVSRARTYKAFHLEHATRLQKSIDFINDNASIFNSRIVG